jgi:hypothetical protein
MIFIPFSTYAGMVKTYRILSGTFPDLVEGSHQERNNQETEELWLHLE